MVIIGGGDTGADCLGTAHRQGAASVTQLEIMPAPPDRRAAGQQPVADLPDDHAGLQRARGGRRAALLGQHRAVPRRRPSGNVRALLLHEVELVDGRFQKIEGTERELPADLVFLAMGFTGAQREGLVDALGVEVDGRGNVARDAEFMSTVPGRVRRRRHGPRPVADRLGDRRGPRRGRAPRTPGSPATRCCPGRSPRRRSRCAERTGAGRRRIRVAGAGSTPSGAIR